MTVAFLKEGLAKAGEQRDIPDISRGALSKMMHYHWPGNVRELRNVVERSLIMAEGTVLRAADLPLEMQRSDASGRPAGGEALDLASVEREHIARVLRRTGGNKTRTAALLGIGLTTLYRKIEEYGL